MARRYRTMLTAVTVLTLTAGVLTVGQAASAAPPPGSTTVSVTSTGSFGNSNDSPASPFIDKDGTFYFQSSVSQYGDASVTPRAWSFYSGTNFDSYSRNSISDAVNPANSSDSNANTTWRCNNSPTGLTATAASSSTQKNYCDLVGVWVDPDTGDWYGLVHNEFTPFPFGDGIHYDAIDYAVSTNQGQTWTIQGHAITSPYSTTRNDTTAFPNQTYYYGDGDPRLFVDAASGYFYVYYGSRIVEKNGNWDDDFAHVARAPMSSKMATGSWSKWYNGAWSQPGVGGSESNMVPVDGSNANGYTPVAGEYSPSSTGTSAQQIAAGKLPPKSPLFVMNIAYNAYLGLYIGEPEQVDTSTPGAQQFFATDNLATQKWYPIGNTGSYTDDSWYRWFVDGGNKTSSTIIGKQFRSYCSFSCYSNSGGLYESISLAATTPAAAPIDLSKTYTIASGAGQMLAQVSGGTATTSTASTSGGSTLADWRFGAVGDGSYTVTNVSSGQALSVDSTTNTGRSWNAKPTTTSIVSGASTVGQQWFLIANTATSDGSRLGTFRLVNRYSGTVLGLSTVSSRLADTAPARAWTDASATNAGLGRTAAEQTLTLTAVGATPVKVVSAGSGRCLDDPNSSTTSGTQIEIWDCNTGANQQWTFGSGNTMTVLGKCLDASGGGTAAGTPVIIYPCTGGANQQWTVASDGTIRGAASGLCLDVTSGATTNGTLIELWGCTANANQRWTLTP